MAASEDPAIRTALDAYQAGALRWLGGGVIAIVLGFLLGAAGVAIAGGAQRRYPLVGVAVVTLVLLGIVACIAGIGALVRVLRWRRGLARSTWQYGRLRLAGPAIMTFEPAGYDELDPDDEPVRLRLLSTAIWRSRALQGLNGSEIFAAPVGNGQWVLTADGVNTVYGARVVRRRR